MADPTTNWLGLELRSPFIVGASPLADDLLGLRDLVAAGAGAVVLRSVFEEQILAEQLAVHRFMDSHVDNDAALNLYRGFGFVDLPERLRVFEGAVAT